MEAERPVVPPPAKAHAETAAAEPGLLDPAAVDEARALVDAALASARSTFRLASIEWQLCKAGWARLLWLMPLFVVLALSVWASLLAALFSLVMALSGGAVVIGWLSVIGVQVGALCLAGWHIQRTLCLSRFARTRAALSSPAPGAAAGGPPA